MCITGQNRRTDVFSPLINSMVLFYIDPPKLDATLECLIEILRISRPRDYIKLRKHFSLFAFLVEVGLLPNVSYNCQFAKFIM
jgi:hypothetical protein